MEKTRGGKRDERVFQVHIRNAYSVCDAVYNRVWSIDMLTSATTKMAVAVLLTVSSIAWHPGGGEFKCYMDYRAITDTSSPQYDLQLDAWTDNTGIRRVGCFYCVALGSAFGTDIGTRYVVTLSTGKQIPVILADQKADGDTTADHTRDYNGAVIEFIVDTQALPDVVRLTGDVSSIPLFGGEVKEIRRLKHAGM